MANEKIFWKGEPSPVAVVSWAIGQLKLFLILIGIVLFLYIGSATEPALDTLLMYIAGIGGLYFLSVIYSFFLRKTYKYSVSNRGVTFEGGIINKQFKNIPYHKITDVTKSQSIIQRLFGISDLHIQTAGTSFPEISFLGLKDPDTPRNYILQMLEKVPAQQK